MARPAPVPTPSGAPEGDGRPPLDRRERALALTGTLVALLLAGLDQTIVATAGPEIQRDLGIPAAVYPWITAAYLVASTVMMPIYGKLSDVYGRKPILLVGVGCFLLGSFLCGIAPGTVPLIGFRAVQGLGAASLFTTTLAVIADLFPPRERGKYMGLIGAVMGISSVVGPLVGGIITDLFGWHWVFFVNLPVGAVALWLIITRMPRLGGRAGDAGARIDVAGAVWLVVGVVPLLVALSLGRSDSAAAGGGLAWNSGPMLSLLAVAAVGLSAFVRVERRASEPILDLRLFRNRVVGLGTASMFVLGTAFLFSVIFLPLYLVNVVGISATRAGLSLTPLTLAMVASSVGAGNLVSRIGRYKRLLTASLMLLSAAFAIMGFTLRPDSTQAEVTLKMILVGLGIGPTLPLYMVVVQNAAPPEELGVVTAAATFSRSLGQVIGIAALGTLFAAALTASLAERTREALAGLPPAARALVADAVPVLADGRAGEAVSFDAAAVRERIERSAALAAGVAGAAQGAPRAGADGVIDGAGPDGSAGKGGAAALEAAPGDVAAALAAVDRLRAAFALALTHAVSVLYRVGIAIIALGLLLTLLIPELPLRREHGGGPAGPAPSAPPT